jgi:hypothetical protein
MKSLIKNYRKFSRFTRTKKQLNKHLISRLLTFFPISNTDWNLDSGSRISVDLAFQFLEILLAKYFIKHRESPFKSPICREFIKTLNLQSINQLNPEKSKASRTTFTVCSTIDKLSSNLKKVFRETWIIFANFLMGKFISFTMSRLFFCNLLLDFYLMIDCRCRLNIFVFDLGIGAIFWCILKSYLWI